MNKAIYPATGYSEAGQVANALETWSDYIRVPYVDSVIEARIYRMHYINFMNDASEDLNYFEQLLMNTWQGVMADPAWLSMTDPDYDRSLGAQIGGPRWYSAPYIRSIDIKIIDKGKCNYWMPKGSVGKFGYVSFGGDQSKGISGDTSGPPHWINLENCSLVADDDPCRFNKLGVNVYLLPGVRADLTARFAAFPPKLQYSGGEYPSSTGYPWGT